MATRKQKAEVGLFLVICVLLIVGGVVLITGLKYEPRERFYVEFKEESILGLSTGGLVEYMGVPVGNVSNIVVRPNKDNGLPTAIVTIEVIEEKVQLYNGVMAQLVLYSFATGTMAIELSGGNPAEGELPPESVIPSKPSLVTSVSKQIEEVISDVRAVTDTISTGLKGLPEGELAQIIEHADELVTQGRDFIAQLQHSVEDIQADAHKGLDNINKVAEDARKLIRDTNETVVVVRKKVEAIGTNKLSDSAENLMKSVNELTDRLKKTVGTVEGLAKSAQGTTQNVEYNLRQTLRTLSETLNSVRDMVQYLQRNPSAILHGRGNATGEE